MAVSKRKYILIIAIFAIAFVFVYFAFIRNRRLSAETNDFLQIAKRGSIRIVTDYSPSGYFVSGDSITGFNHDLMCMLQNYTTLKINVSLESSLEKSLDGLYKGKYDVIVRNIPVTTELRDTLGFTEPIMQNKQVLVQRKKEYNDGVEPIRSHLELAGKILYVPKNSPAILRIKNLSHEIGDTIYYAEDELYGSEQLVMKVASGEIDYTVCDERIAERLSESLPEIDYKTLIGFTHLEAWAVRNTSIQLLDSLNRWLSDIKGTKDYESIYKKYYR